MAYNTPVGLWCWVHEGRDVQRCIWPSYLGSGESGLWGWITEGWCQSVSNNRLVYMWIFRMVVIDLTLPVMKTVQPVFKDENLICVWKGVYEWCSYTQYVCMMVQNRHTRDMIVSKSWALRCNVQEPLEMSDEWYGIWPSYLSLQYFMTCCSYRTEPRFATFQFTTKLQKDHIVLVIIIKSSNSKLLCCISWNRTSIMYMFILDTQRRLRHFKGDSI